MLTTPQRLNPGLLHKSVRNEETFGWEMRRLQECTISPAASTLDDLDEWESRRDKAFMSAYLKNRDLKKFEGIIHFFLL